MRWIDYDGTEATLPPKGVLGVLETQVISGKGYLFHKQGRERDGDPRIGDRFFPIPTPAQCEALEAVVEAARYVAASSYYVANGGKRYCVECHRVAGDAHKGNCATGALVVSLAALDEANKEASNGQG